MRQGQQAAIVLDKAGEICALSMGTDFVSEHEWGYKSLQKALCPPLSGQTQRGTGLWTKVPTPAKVQEVCMIQRFLKSEAEILEALRAGERVGYPPLCERLGLLYNLNELQFVRGEENGEQVAVFAYRGYGTISLNERGLELEGREYVGAWSDRDFGFKVRGLELCLKLERFAKAVQAGGGLFADSFLKQSGAQKLKGLAIARKSALSSEHWEAMYWAQEAWEAGMRSKAGAPPAAPVKLPKYALC